MSLASRYDGVCTVATTWRHGGLAGSLAVLPTQQSDEGERQRGRRRGCGCGRGLGRRRGRRTGDASAVSAVMKTKMKPGRQWTRDITTYCTYLLSYIVSVDQWRYEGAKSQKIGPFASDAWTESASQSSFQFARVRVCAVGLPSVSLEGTTPAPIQSLHHHLIMPWEKRIRSSTRPRRCDATFGGGRGVRMEEGGRAWQQAAGRQHRIGGWDGNHGMGWDGMSVVRYFWAQRGTRLRESEHGGDAHYWWIGLHDQAVTASLPASLMKVKLRGPASSSQQRSAVA